MSDLIYVEPELIEYLKNKNSILTISDEYVMAG